MFDVATLYDTEEGLVDAQPVLLDFPKGIISGLADAEISYKLNRDPARYNVTDDDSSLVNEDLLWDSKQVKQSRPRQAQPAGILPYQNQQIESASARVLLEVFKMVIRDAFTLPQPCMDAETKFRSEKVFFRKKKLRLFFQVRIF